MPFYNNLLFRFILTNKPASQQALLQMFVSKTIYVLRQVKDFIVWDYHAVHRW